MTDIAEVTSASSIEEGAGEQGKQLTSDRRNRRGSGLDSMVLAELKQLASSLGIRGTGGMRKSQLIDAIRTAQGGAGTPARSAGTGEDNGHSQGSQPGPSRDRDASGVVDELQQAPREADGQREEVQMGDRPVQPELVTATQTADSAPGDGRGQTEISDGAQTRENSGTPARSAGT
ncbi:MAG TPA: Rho termination factor N-terminal domain-containing protein, partial [Propionibacteriaceae bacterium]|nr:Rho termination factor N-terminal domain-containing protein [Propionibacteriaceae bacterium]